MFNKFKSAPNNAPTESEEAADPVAPEELVLIKEDKEEPVRYTWNLPSSWTRPTSRH